MMISLSNRDPEPLAWFWRQLAWLAVGVVSFLMFAHLDYRVFRTSTAAVFGIYAVSVVLLVLVLIFGKTVHGSRAWFDFGSVTFQPVELVKAALLFVFAKYFAEQNIEIWRFRHVALSALYLSVPLLLVLLQPDWGSGLTLGALWFGMILMAGARGRQVAILVFIFLFLGALSWTVFLTENQKSRIMTVFQPERDPFGIAYNQRQALIAIGSGGLLGKGLGEGSQTQLKFLPASRTDFVFAALAEELGFLGALAVLAAYGIIFFQIAKLALAGNNNFARLFSLGFLILLATHIAINLGMNLGVFPVIGIGLPFVSYGGSSLVVLSMLLGVVMSIKAKG